ncbi:MAG: PHP domain-containing protein [Lachnospiraceae bacterium]|nr:PHP domain-containing protein [Lachnospiraceae bacterium]
MKKNLLPEKGSFYKAELHIHTTISDGTSTPEELKKLHQEQGYSIIAITDHNILLPHNELTDENFLAITAAEWSVYENDEKAYHINVYSKDPNRVRSSLFSKEYVHKNAWPYITEEMLKDDDHRSYSQEYLNDAIRRAKEEGFLVSFNHPVWSLNHYPDYCDLEGVWGLEVVNYGGLTSGYPENVQPLDDFLVQGKQVFPLCVTDAHHVRQMFGGFVMVKAEKLEYRTVMEALERGDFYASAGPAFEDLYLEDGVLKVRCSKVKRIRLSTGIRYARMKMAKDGEFLTSAEFDLKAHLERCITVREETGVNSYVRITLTDEAGREAYSRAYFLDELM